MFYKYNMLFIKSIIPSNNILKITIVYTKYNCKIVNRTIQSHRKYTVFNNSYWIYIIIQVFQLISNNICYNRLSIRRVCLYYIPVSKQSANHKQLHRNYQLKIIISVLSKESRYYFVALCHTNKVSCCTKLFPCTYTAAAICHCVRVRYIVYIMSYNWFSYYKKPNVPDICVCQ